MCTFSVLNPLFCTLSAAVVGEICRSEVYRTCVLAQCTRHRIQRLSYPTGCTDFIRSAHRPGEEGDSDGPSDKIIQRRQPVSTTKRAFADNSDVCIEVKCAGHEPHTINYITCVHRNGCLPGRWCTQIGCLPVRWCTQIDCLSVHWCTQIDCLPVRWCTQIDCLPVHWCTQIERVYYGHPSESERFCKKMLRWKIIAIYPPPT